MIWGMTSLETHAAWQEVIVEECRWLAEILYTANSEAKEMDSVFLIFGRLERCQTPIVRQVKTLSPM